MKVYQDIYHYVTWQNQNFARLENIFSKRCLYSKNKAKVSAKGNYSSKLKRTLIRGPFLESPENFSGPISHSKNYDLLIL